MAQVRACERGVHVGEDPEGVTGLAQACGPVLDLIREISATGKTTLDSLKAVSAAGIPDFLFRKSDAAYLLAIRKRAMEVLTRDMLETMQADAGKTPSSTARLEAVQWIAAQEREVIDRFRKYLSLP